MIRAAAIAALLATPAFADAPPPPIDGTTVVTVLENQLRAVTHEWAIDEGKIAALQAQIKALEEKAKAPEAIKPP